MIFLSCKEMIGGSLSSCIRFQFFIQASFLEDTEGWYCVANGNISFSFLLFVLSLDSPSLNFISGSRFSIKFCG